MTNRSSTFLPKARRRRRSARSLWRHVLTRERQHQLTVVLVTLALMALAVVLTIYLIR